MRSVKLLVILLLPFAAQAQNVPLDTFTLYRNPGGAFTQNIAAELGYANHKTFAVSTTIACPTGSNVLRTYQPSPTTAFVLQRANGVGTPSSADVTNGSNWHPLLLGVDLTKPVSGSAIVNLALYTNTSPTTVYWDCGQ